MKSKIIRLAFFATCLFFTGINIASGAVYVYPMEVSVGLKGASQIKVISQDNDVQFIKVSLKQILEPGTPQENEKTGDAGNAAGLVITPHKIALASASERVVRLVSVIPPKKETTWRAYFESVNEDNFISPPTELKQSDSTVSIGVNVVWGALIHVAPEKVLPSLKFTVNSGKIFNDGTIRIPIKELGICERSGQCQWKKKSLTIYPDTTVSFPGITFARDKEYRVKYLNWITGKSEEISLSQQRDH